MHTEGGVLIACSRQDLGSSLKSLLETIGRVTSIRSATSTAGAIEMIQEWHPLLVLLDSELPNIGSPDCLALIKKQSRNGHCLVLANDFKMYREYISAGATEVRLKGTIAADLVSTVEQFLNKDISPALPNPVRNENLFGSGNSRRNLL